MTTLLEGHAPIIFVGIALEAVLAIAFVNTRRRVLLWAMLGVVLLVAAGVVLERLVVTDRERVEAAMDGAVEALEADDLGRFLNDYVAPEAAQTRSRASYALGIVEITSFRITRLKVTVDRRASPATAQARFHGTVHYKDRGETVTFGTYRAEFVVTLRRERDRWLITDHVEHTRIGG
jgi:hypothetical protein